MASKKNLPVTSEVTPQKKRSATSYDVAMLAGVSQSAVSRCFKPGASVSPETRARVLKATKELDYIPNALARSLITRRSNLVAVLISNLTNLYYPEVLSELSKQFVSKGMRILLFTVPHESDIDQTITQIWQYQVDGVIAATRLSLEHVTEFERHGIPLVLYNRTLAEKSVDAVVCDQIEGARILVSRLAAAGHQRFAIISGPTDSVVGQERTRGARERVLELGLREPQVVMGHYDYQSGVNGLRQLMKNRASAPDAIICGNDIMAIGCIDAARHEFRIDVPKMLSVAGFDGVEPSTWMSHNLTTLRQPVQKMAQAAAEMLLSLIDNHTSSPEKRVFSAQFIEGGTSRLDHPVPPATKKEQK
ncbi:LacI family DNA-binding transcriptional regulator [Undibacterium sp. Ji22W]|uniref:LacI family DNA-binding transcriptional regulator n=1 Tax=Undibacterium sp. Ji22W TaxID=3413038 RepID=UPI003BF05B18